MAVPLPSQIRQNSYIFLHLIIRKPNATLDFSNDTSKVLKRKNENVEANENVAPAPKRVSNPGTCSCKTGCKTNRCACKKNTSVSFHPFEIVTPTNSCYSLKNRVTNLYLQLAFDTREFTQFLTS